MQNDTLLVIRIVFTGLFVMTLLAGVYLLKNFEKLFGVDPMRLRAADPRPPSLSPSDDPPAAAQCGGKIGNMLPPSRSGRCRKRSSGTGRHRTS